jgi:hypothetical protein
MRRERRDLFGQDCLAAALLLIAVAVLGGCGREKAYQADTSSPVLPGSCAVTDQAIRQWIENPSMPLEPAGSADACFYNFAWQELFALTQSEGGTPRFATWPSDQELFPASGDPKPWHTGARLMLGRQIRKGRGMPDAHGVIADQFKQAAALTPLTDQHGRWVHYSVVVNQPEYDYIRCCELYRGNCFNSTGCNIDLPDGSVEIKLAWRVLETCDLPDSKSPCTKEDASRYLTVKGEVEIFPIDDPSQPAKTFPATLGLVGMHIVHWTKQYPDAVWATFEHVDNAPDCPPPPVPPPAGVPPTPPPAGGPKPPPGFSDWAFYNANCNPPEGPYCQTNQYCPACPVKVPPDVAKAFNEQHAGGWQIPADNVITCTPSPNDFNQPVKLQNGDEVWIYLFDPKECQKPPIPTQTCRATPISADVNGLNDQVRAVLAGLKKLPGLPTVLANYQLVAAEWFDNRQLQPQPQVQVANTTMETYLQTLPTGCVLCHSNQGTVGGVNPIPSAPPMQFNSGLADRSMVFQQIRQFGTNSACTTLQASKCKAWKEGCPAEM